MVQSTEVVHDHLAFVHGVQVATATGVARAFGGGFHGFREASVVRALQAGGKLGGVVEQIRGTEYRVAYGHTLPYLLSQIIGSHSC